LAVLSLSLALSYTGHMERIWGLAEGIAMLSGIEVRSLIISHPLPSTAEPRLHPAQMTRIDFFLNRKTVSGASPPSHSPLLPHS
jgi:hypothetical protein